MLVLYSQLPGLDRHCTSTVGKLFFPQSEDGWTCCTPSVVQTLVFNCRLPELNRHWVDLADLLSQNYFFHSRKKFGPVLHPPLYKRWYFTVDYQGWIETGWILHIYFQKTIFSTVGRRLDLLYIDRCTNTGILQSTTRAD